MLLFDTRSFSTAALRQTKSAVSRKDEMMTAHPLKSIKRLFDGSWISQPLLQFIGTCVRQSLLFAKNIYGEGKQITHAHFNLESGYPGRNCETLNTGKLCDLHGVF